MFKKSIAVMLILTMAGTTLVGCGSKVKAIENGDQSVVKEEVKVETKTDEVDDDAHKGEMASSPEELLEAVLSTTEGLTAEEYSKKFEEEVNGFTFDLNENHDKLPQKLDEATDPRNTIKAEEFAKHIDALKAISLQSKEDGEILWGRIQGTKYEKMARDYVEETLKGFNLDDVYSDEFEGKMPLWRPTENNLEIVSAPGFENGKTFKFDNALTPFASAVTPENGIEKEVIYVGEATDAELKGRDLTDKIVLLRSRAVPSGAMYSSARMGFSRIAIGTYGKPAGIIIWWDIPGAKQIAGRVGAPGGGDDIGFALPWISIGDDDGRYLRNLLDKATDENPVKVSMNVQGKMESGKERMAGNVYGVLEGKTDKYIVIPTHVDGYFYGIIDNAGSVALNLELANYFSKMPKEDREYGIVFLFVGDHEVPGVGGTVQFAKKYEKELNEKLLAVFRPEKLAGISASHFDGPINQLTNAELPLMLLLTNRSPLMLDIFKNASNLYSLPVCDRYIVDPVADELGFFPPFNNLDDPIAFGWHTSGGMYYHATSDGDMDGLVNMKSLEKITRAHAYVIEELFKHTEADLRKDEIPRSGKSIFEGNMFKMFLGQY